MALVGLARILGSRKSERHGGQDYRKKYSNRGLNYTTVSFSCRTKGLSPSMIQCLFSRGKESIKSRTDAWTAIRVFGQDMARGMSEGAIPPFLEQETVLP